MLKILESFNLVSAIFRMILACVCGGVVGLERTRRLKEAGIRTHCIIAATSALMMLVSKYGFTDLTQENSAFFEGVRGADPARIAAQVVSGITFLGAGVIFKNGSSVKGLTTAAGIWATAGIGLAIGSGMYIPGIVLTVTVVVIQVIFHRISIGNDAYSESDVQIVAEATPDFSDKLLSAIDNKKIQILSMKINRLPDGSGEYTVILRTKNEFRSAEAVRMFGDVKEIRSITFK